MITEKFFLGEAPFGNFEKSWMSEFNKIAIVSSVILGCGFGSCGNVTHEDH